MWTWGAGSQNPQPRPGILQRGTRVGCAAGGVVGTAGLGIAVRGLIHFHSERNLKSFKGPKPALCAEANVRAV